MKQIKLLSNKKTAGMSVYLIFIVIMLLVSGCKPYKIDTNSINQLKTSSKDGILYALPQTRLKVEVQTKKKIVKAGPFAAYASKLLGIDNAPLHDQVSWELESVKVIDQNITDPDQYYYIDVKRDRNNDLKDLLTWSEQGFYIDFYKQSNQLDERMQLDVEKQVTVDEMINFPLSGNLVEKIDTLYKTVFKDSVFVRMPVYKKQMVEKSIEDKARETAEIIISLRKTKFNKLADAEDLSSADLLESVVDNIDQLEQSYLDLFTGKELYQSYTYYFYVVPNDSIMNKDMTIFNFSEQKGIIEGGASLGVPVVLRLKQQGTTRMVEEFNVRNERLKQGEGNIYYRLPDMTNVQVIANNKTLFDKTLPLIQFGTLTTIPVEYLIRNE